MTSKMQGLQDTIPAFLGKLWKMVNDPSTDHLISWSSTGNTFFIQNQAQFWYELLPLYYKHNNMSSFVRQLNMYGFHKISSLENTGNAVRSDKDDAIQFYHPNFQKDEPDKLKHIKRKSTNAKPPDTQSAIRHEDLTKVLTDVKQLRGRQSGVDSQLSAMKQENTVLWRELAILRQKHVKQQQIVNKLIQFLVTLVQPAASPRMGVGVKRRIPLMLHESPGKKARPRKNSRQQNDGGPTIHELDPEVDLSPEQLLEEAAVIEEDIPLEAAVAKKGKTNKIDSPISDGSQLPQDSSTSQPVDTPVANKNGQNDLSTSRQQPLSTDLTFWDKPEFVNIDDVNDDELINTLEKSTPEKVFLNPNNRDTLIGSLLNSGSYNPNDLGGKNIGNAGKQPNNKQIVNASHQPSMQVATKNPKINNGTPGTNECFSEDLDLHLDSTQNELDQLKDILNGCNTFDANTLLDLFADGDPDYGIRSTSLQNKDNNSADEEADSLLAGNEVTPESTWQ